METIENMDNTILPTVHCQYYNENDFNTIFDTHRNPKFTILHLNIRSLNANRIELQTYLENLNIAFDVIALSEVGNTNVEENSKFFKDYNFYWDESITKSGGTGLFITSKFNVLRKRNDLKLPNQHQKCSKYQVENTWLECEIPGIKKPILIGTVYRHPSGNIDLFNEELEKIIQCINKEKKLCIISGDFNIDLKNDQHTPTTNFANMMLSENYLPHITSPTRLTSKTATLIDNIFLYHTLETIDEKITSGNLLTEISDHLPNFLIYGEKKYKMENERPYVRIYSERNIEKYKKYLETEDIWSKFNQETATEKATDEYIKIVNTGHDMYFPLTQISIKRYKDKKWITKGIKVSCKVKNQLYKKYLKKSK